MVQLGASKNIEKNMKDFKKKINLRGLEAVIFCLCLTLVKHRKIAIRA